MDITVNSQGRYKIAEDGDLVKVGSVETEELPDDEVEALLEITERVLKKERIGYYE